MSHFKGFFRVFIHKKMLQCAIIFKPSLNAFHAPRSLGISLNNIKEKRLIHYLIGLVYEINFIIWCRQIGYCFN
jgi:hypothetical protein